MKKMKKIITYQLDQNDIENIVKEHLAANYTELKDTEFELVIKKRVGSKLTIEVEVQEPAIKNG